MFDEHKATGDETSGEMRSCAADGVSSLPSHCPSGTPVNCCRGEAKHQELKRTMSTCSGRPRDVLRHLARRANDTLAVRSLEARVPYKARVYRESSHEWESCEVEPSVECASVVATLWGKFRAPHEPPRHVATGTPRGGRRWRATLKDLDSGPDSDNSSDTGVGGPAEDPRNRFLPARSTLFNAYSEWFGCGEEVQGVPCYYGDTCITCGGVGPTDLTSDVECSSWSTITEEAQPGENHETVVMGAWIGGWTEEEEGATPIFDAGGRTWLSRDTRDTGGGETGNTGGRLFVCCCSSRTSTGGVNISGLWDSST